MSVYAGLFSLLDFMEIEYTDIRCRYETITRDFFAIFLSTFKSVQIKAPFLLQHSSNSWVQAIIQFLKGMYLVLTLQVHPI